jgi:hypothetical protein
MAPVAPSCAHTLSNSRPVAVLYTWTRPSSPPQATSSPPAPAKQGRSTEVDVLGAGGWNVALGPRADSDSRGALSPFSPISHSHIARDQSVVSRRRESGAAAEATVASGQSTTMASASSERKSKKYILQLWQLTWKEGRKERKRDDERACEIEREMACMWDIIPMQEAICCLIGPFGIFSGSFCRGSAPTTTIKRRKKKSKMDRCLPLDGCPTVQAPRHGHKAPSSCV